MQRRDFLRNGSAAALGGAALAAPARAAARPRLRVGVIGTGLRGQPQLQLLLHRDDVDVVALCDIEPLMLKQALARVEKAGKPRPQVFGENGDVQAWRQLLELKDLDAVLIVTPWEWHAPMAIAAMEARVAVGCEVVAGITLQDHWDVLRTQQRTGTPYMLLENVCYRRDVMAVLQMVRAGLFGELVHLQGGYQHDLRAVKFNSGDPARPYGGGAEFGAKGWSEARWRTEHSVRRNGELYPSHGIGPCAMVANIHRGNRFTHINSFASKARGLHEYVEAQGGKQHPNAKVRFALGDLVTTTLACENGETIILQHDTSLPRPYSLGFRVQGTKGLWMDVNQSVHVEGISPPHRWEPFAKYGAQFDHPLWKKYAASAEGAGHGGMDFFVIHAFVEALKADAPMPIDIYDAVAWSAITPLSEQSIAEGFRTLAFPDFTEGQWKTRQPIFAFDDRY
ncbi:MAG: Gfo/Idh/MocA family oxidoreductase [Roseateles sp.]|uniref:Gfo/Idh/MocA family protein n=1 Tax=Roseateles sp. TaxID=1971397 RepID=UPI0039EB2DDE